MQSRLALVLAGLSLAISLLALTSVGGAGTTGPAASGLVTSNGVGLGFYDNTGFKSISSPGTGQYCVNLKGWTSSQIPLVAPEVNFSASQEPLAMWNRFAPNCPSGKIEVDTYTDGTYDPSDDVSFTIVVS